MAVVLRRSAPVKIPLDRRSPQPVYLQIRQRIHRLIQSGTLQPGDRLPSIRSLAEAAQVNKLTVIEAYSVLEADGLIYARPGSGYFVSEPSVTSPIPPSRFAPSQEVIIPDQGEMSYFDIYMASVSALHQDGVTVFSSGFPHPHDTDILQRVSRRAFKEMGALLFNYDLPQGQYPLRKQIAQLLVQKGLDASPDQLIVTNGSMQGLSLVMQEIVQPGDWVIVESPTFHGALAVLQQLGARVIGIPMTREGMNLDLLAQYLHSHRPRLIYTISTLHNPTGITTSLAHRQQLLDLARRYDCRILEDNAYEGLNFDPVPPPIKALDQDDLVIYAGTFTKTLMPGLRVGYLVVTGDDYGRLLERKLLHDLCVSTASQAIVSEYLATGYYRRHLSQLCSRNLQGRGVMLKALEQHFPEEASWTVPNGGLFLWVKLPDRLPMQLICSEAAAEGILVTPGSTFFPNLQGYPAMRLNFSYDAETIERGMAILGRIMKRHL
ncbi:MAG: PLP-dependent aminotransferase family protein [Elainellaceae cyanobacterium]